MGTMPRWEAPVHGSQTTKRNSQRGGSLAFPMGILHKRLFQSLTQCVSGPSCVGPSSPPSPGRSGEGGAVVPLTWFTTKALYEVERKRRREGKGRRQKEGKNHFY